MSEPVDNSLYDNPDLAQFYDLPNRWDVDFDYCAALAREAKSVLDLGCGTGEFAAFLANGREIVGVDPAAAMLGIARKRPGGNKVNWVQGDARSVQLGEKFDLIVLTGHTFQVFLTTRDQMAVLKTITAHLSPDGRFIFDSRNPNFKEPKGRKKGGKLHRFEHLQFGQIEMWNKSTYNEETGILTYTNGYIVVATGKEYSETAQIRYTPQAELAEMIENAGLTVNKWLGDWQGTQFYNEAREIIPVGRLA